MARKRKLFDKESFGEGNRQRYVWVFLVCMFVVFAFDAAGRIRDVSAYLTFLSFLSGSFILGYSGSETMKLFRATSAQQEMNMDETRSDTQLQNINESYAAQMVRPKMLDDGSID